MFVLRLFASLMLAACLLCSVQAQAADMTFPELTGRIVDVANVFQSGVKADLESHLADFEASTGQQIVVVTLPTLDGQEIADYTYQLGRHWEIGQKGKNDGVIILVVPTERVARIEAGYGLEGDLTDAASSLVINNIMIPFFKTGDYQTGIVQGTDAVMQIIRGDKTILKNAKASQQDDNWLTTLIVIYIIIWFLMRLRGGGRRSSSLAPFILGSMLGGGRSGGGGLGGGFRGGGGSFGGGGASGRW